MAGDPSGGVEDLLATPLVTDTTQKALARRAEGNAHVAGGDGSGLALDGVGLAASTAVCTRLLPPNAGWESCHATGCRRGVSRRLEGLILPAPSPPIPEPMSEADRTRLAGQKDSNVMLRWEIAGRLPDAQAEVQVIPGAAHPLPLEAPGAVAELIVMAAGETSQSM